MATEVLDKPEAVEATAPAPARKRRSLLLSILLVLLAAVAVLVVFIATRPNDFRVSRSASIAAPPEEVFALVNDFHQWEAWSPWAKIDPNATSRFEGPTAGEGAKFFWSGNNEVGEGNMTIVESDPNKRIRIQLDFIRPFAGTNDVEFTFRPTRQNETAVSWNIAGKNNFLSKAISLVIDCEKMTGDQFEQGLASLKKIVEKRL